MPHRNIPALFLISLLGFLVACHPAPAAEAPRASTAPSLQLIHHTLPRAGSTEPSLPEEPPLQLALPAWSRMKIERLFPQKKDLPHIEGLRWPNLYLQEPGEEAKPYRYDVASRELFPGLPLALSDQRQSPLCFAGDTIYWIEAGPSLGRLKSYQLLYQKGVFSQILLSGWTADVNPTLWSDGRQLYFMARDYGKLAELEPEARAQLVLYRARGDQLRELWRSEKRYATGEQTGGLNRFVDCRFSARRGGNLVCYSIYSTADQCTHLNFLREGVPEVDFSLLGNVSFQMLGKTLFLSRPGGFLRGELATLQEQGLSVEEGRYPQLLPDGLGGAYYLQPQGPRVGLHYLSRVRPRDRWTSRPVPLEWQEGENLRSVHPSPQGLLLETNRGIYWGSWPAEAGN